MADIIGYYRIVHVRGPLQTLIRRVSSVIDVMRRVKALENSGIPREKALILTLGLV